MDVKICKICGHMFSYFGGDRICPDCLKKQEEKLETVKRYISENPAAKIEEIAKACEVSASDIRKWAREERLSFPEESPIRIYCENCDAPIKSGRYCANCSDNLKKQAIAELRQKLKH